MWDAKAVAVWERLRSHIKKVFIDEMGEAMVLIHGKCRSLEGRRAALYLNAIVRFD